MKDLKRQNFGISKTKKMEHKTFYQKLIVALVDQGYQIDEEIYNESIVRFDSSQVTNKALRSIVDVANFLNPTTANFNYEKFIQHIREISGIRNRLLIMYRFVLSQPTILGFVDADNLSNNECIKLAQEFDGKLLNFREQTASLGLGGSGSVLGLMVYVYSSSANSKSFMYSAMANCKISHFWKQTNLVPWVIDIQGKQITKHSGMPFVVDSILNVSKLKSAIF